MEEDLCSWNGAFYFFQDFSSSQIIFIDAKQYQSKLVFCKHQHTDSKVYMEKQKIQNSQHNTEKEQNLLISKLCIQL